MPVSRFLTTTNLQPRSTAWLRQSTTQPSLSWSEQPIRCSISSHDKEGSSILSVVTTPDTIPMHHSHSVTLTASPYTGTGSVTRLSLSFRSSYQIDIALHFLVIKPFQDRTAWVPPQQGSAAEAPEESRWAETISMLYGIVCNVNDNLTRTFSCALYSGDSFYVQALGSESTVQSGVYKNLEAIKNSLVTGQLILYEHRCSEKW